MRDLLQHPANCDCPQCTRAEFWAQYREGLDHDRAERVRSAMDLRQGTLDERLAKVAALSTGELRQLIHPPDCDCHRCIGIEPGEARRDELPMDECPCGQLKHRVALQCLDCFRLGWHPDELPAGVDLNEEYRLKLTEWRRSKGLCIYTGIRRDDCVCFTCAPPAPVAKPLPVPLPSKPPSWEAETKDEIKHALDECWVGGNDDASIDDLASSVFDALCESGTLCPPLDQVDEVDTVLCCPSCRRELCTVRSSQVPIMVIKACEGCQREGRSHG